MAVIAVFFSQTALATNESCGKHGSSEYIFPPFRGWNHTSSWIQLAPSLMKHDTNDQQIEYDMLNHTTWNMVNTTDGTTAKVSFGPITVCHYNGDHNCMWVVSFWNNQLTLNHSKISSELTFQKVSHDDIELTDQYGGTIHLIR